MDLRRGPQGPALVASGKASHHASCSGASRDSSPVDAGALYLVWSRCRNLRKPLQCLHGPWGTSGVSQVSQSSFLVDACTCNFLQSCSISVTLPFAWIQESVCKILQFERNLRLELKNRALQSDLTQSSLRLVFHFSSLNRQGFHILNFLLLSSLLLLSH